MKSIMRFLRKKDFGDVGIGSMIVFIAMVLVAGIAASVLIQTAGKLESQAMATGQETIGEVSTGLAVYDVEGYCSAVTENISKLAITVRPRAGSADIDMNQVFVEISDTDYKIILRYVDATANNYADNDGADGFDDIFGTSVFPAVADEYGILVLEDADGSCSESNPVINAGDKIILTIDTSVCFNISGSLGIVERTNVWGSVVPEQGSPGVIAFTAPSTFNNVVMDLQ